MVGEVVDFINTGTPLDPDKAAAAILDYLQTRPEFVAAGIAEDGSVWGQFPDGSRYTHADNRPHGDTGATAAAPRGVQGIPATFQTVSSGAHLPKATEAMIINGLDESYGDIPTGITAALVKAGYQVVTSEAEVDLLKFAPLKDVGVVVFRSHGGGGDIWTATPVTPDNEVDYADDMDNGLLRHMSAPTALNPDYDPEDSACQEVNIPPPQCRERLSERHYAITPLFIKEYWRGALSDHAVIVLDVCGSDGAFPAAVNTPASLAVGWDGTVSEIGSNRILTLFFDRMVGLNKVAPDETPDLRPFDGNRVGQYLFKTEEGIDLIWKNASLEVADDGPTVLVPSIKVISIDEGADEMIIEGMFGDQPGIVFFGDHHITEFDWQPGIIRVPITDNMAGLVRVEQQGRRSNEVPVTEWRGEMRYVGDAGPLGTDLKIDSTFNLHLRADIHIFRDNPWETPISREVTIKAAGDSTATWKASGTSSQTAPTITASGSGEMRVETPESSHDEALFQVTAVLKITTFDAPPLITNARLHAHLASDPKARLKFELPGNDVDSGFPIPQTGAMDPIPFQFDRDFDIPAGSKPGTAPGGFGATLTWKELIAKHEPSLGNPPQALRWVS